MKKNILLSLIIVCSYNYLFSQIVNNMGSGCLRELTYIGKSSYCSNPSYKGFDYFPEDYDNVWVLDFEDNFNGNSLDLSKWKLPYQGVIRDFLFKKEKQWLANEGTTPSIPISNNIKVDVGSLKLIARKEIPKIRGTFVTDWSTIPPTSKTKKFGYSAAGIESKHRFGYGKYEIRCKVPKGKGFWPAFWLYRGNSSLNEYNEIDIFEFWNQYDILGLNYQSNKSAKVPVFHTHHDYYNDGDKYKESCGWNYAHKNGIDYSKYHIFTMIWDYYKIRIYVDGKLESVMTKFLEYNSSYLPVYCNTFLEGRLYYLNLSYPKKEFMHILVNLSIQSDDKSPNGDTPFPSEFEIDYIRYYKKKNCNNLNAINNSDLNMSGDDIYNSIYRNNISLSGNINLVSWGQQLDLIASNEISIKPGVFIDNGSEFIAKINPNCGVSRSGSIASPTLVGKDKKVPLKSRDDIEIYTYPNPVKNILTIKYLMANKLNVSISDFNGKNLYKKIFVNSDKMEIDISFLASGIYILKVTDVNSKGVYKIKKIIKE